MAASAAIRKMSRKKDAALEAYVESLIDHKGNGSNAIVAGKRRRFEKATMELHEELKRGATK